MSFLYFAGSLPCVLNAKLVYHPKELLTIGKEQNWNFPGDFCVRELRSGQVRPQCLVFYLFGSDSPFGLNFKELNFFKIAILIHSTTSLFRKS